MNLSIENVGIPEFTNSNIQQSLIIPSLATKRGSFKLSYSAYLELNSPENVTFLTNSGMVLLANSVELGEIPETQKFKVNSNGSFSSRNYVEKLNNYLDFVAVDSKSQEVLLVPKQVTFADESIKVLLLTSYEEEDINEELDRD